MGDDQRKVVRKEFRNSGDAMADDVVQQLPGQLADPMPWITEESAGVPGMPDLVAIITLHMNRPGAQVAALNQATHAPRYMTELIIVTSRQFEPGSCRQIDQFLSFAFVNGEGFFDVNVAVP